MSAGPDPVTSKGGKAGGGATADAGLRAMGSAAHILIVEDDASVRALLSEILQEEGYEVTAVGDGQSALKILRDMPVHSLVTDFNLPDMDGLELLGRIGRDYPRTVGIIMTAYGTVDLAVKAMKAGAVDFLSKPFEPTLVSLTLKKVLEVQRLRQENVILKHTVLKQPGMQVKNFSPLNMDDENGGGVRNGLNGEASPLVRESFERGLAEGERRATEREAEKVATQCSILRQAICQIEEACDGLAAQLEEQAIGLAFEVARKVVRECAEEKRQVISGQVQNAIARVRDVVREHDLVRIRVHPLDLPVVESLRDTLATVFDGPVALAFESDATVGRGGCLVQTGTRVVDASLESQIARLAAPFQRK